MEPPRAPEATPPPAAPAAESAAQPVAAATDPATAGTAGDAAGAAAEAAAWAGVEASWGDPPAHRAYLDSFGDLEGLAAAGRRYRDVLSARPGDAVALAMKGEILKRATVLGLAMLPRTPPPRLGTGRARRIAVLVLAAWLASTLAYLVYRLFSGTAA